MPSRLFLAYIYLASSMALVGSYVALSGPLVAVFPVFLLAWLRFGIGGLAMLRWLRKPKTEAPLPTKTKRLIFLESFLGNFLFTLCMISGVSMTSAVSAGVIMSLIPAVVALMSWWFLKEKLNVRIWLSIALGVLGVALLALSQGNSAEVENVARMLMGNLLILAAVACEGAYAVIGKRLTATMGPKRITAVINMWGLVLTTPLGLYSAWHFDFAAVALSNWLLLLFYGLSASVWTVWLWMTGLKSVPAAQAGIFTVMLPISAATVGVLLLGETLDVMQLVAFSLALAGLLLATTAKPNAGPAARAR